MKDARRLLGAHRPPCLASSEDTKRTLTTDLRDAPLRDQHLPTYILDVLVPFARDQSQRYAFIIDNLKFETRQDTLLVAPVREATDQATKLKEEGEPRKARELEAIKRVVEDHYVAWSNAMTSTGPDASNKRFRNENLRKVTRSFVQAFRSLNLQCFGAQDAKSVLASCAYQYNHQEKAGLNLDFAFNVAFITLCYLKANSGDDGDCRVLNCLFYDSMVPMRGLAERLTNAAMEEGAALLGTSA